MINYPVYTQIQYPAHLLLYYENVLPLSNMDAGSDLSDKYIHANINLTDTAPFSDQFENQG